MPAYRYIDTAWEETACSAHDLRMYSTEEDARTAYTRERGHEPWTTKRERDRIRARKYRSGHLEQDNAYKRAYYLAHKEEIDAYQKKWREANRERINAKQRAYNAAHREEVNARQRAYYAAKKAKAQDGEHP